MNRLFPLFVAEFKCVAGACHCAKNYYYYYLLRILYSVGISSGFWRGFLMDSLEFADKLRALDFVCSWGF
jgi:hypothetical protein